MIMLCQQEIEVRRNHLNIMWAGMIAFILLFAAFWDTVVDRVHEYKTKHGTHAGDYNSFKYS